MRRLKFNGYERIFDANYPYKTTILGVAVRDMVPSETAKYSKKIVTHIYIKTHGEYLELTETFEDSELPIRKITLNKTGKFKVPEEKKSKHYICDTYYYTPRNKEIHFDKFENSMVKKATSDLFEIFIEDCLGCEGIILNYNELINVPIEDLISVLDIKK